MTYVHSCFRFFFLDLGVWIRVPIVHSHIYSNIYSTNASGRNICTKEETYYRVSDLYSDGNEDMVATFQIFRNRGHNFSDSHARYIVHLQYYSNFRGSISWTTRSGDQTLRGSDNSPESQETSIRSRL